MSQLPDAALRVQVALHQAGIDSQIQQLDASTRSAQEAADALGCRVEHIAKSLIFKDENTQKAVMLVVSGSHQVDIGYMATRYQLNLVKVDADFVRKTTGFAIGGVAPCAHTTPVALYLDETLQQYPLIWAAAGTPHCVMPLSPAQLASLTGGQWISVCS